MLHGAVTLSCSGVLAGLLLLNALGACSTQEPAARPRSIVLVTIDTLRADHVNAGVTPALDRLARESVVFDTAITVSPVTLPSHASLLTARYPTAHGVRDNQVFALPEGTPTYAGWLKARGYATGAFVSAIVLDERYGLSAGFETYDDEMGGLNERSATDTLARAERWLDGARSPFFLWVHLFEPHAPYSGGSYTAEINRADAALGAFFEGLRKRGLWDDAVVSVTSDHGESLGEHGETTHGFFVYDSTVRIPWMLKAAGLNAGRFAPQVRILDVLPTMIALARSAPSDDPPPAAVDGVDLTPYITRNESPRLEAYSETFLPRHQFNWSELTSLRTDGFKYIDAPAPELYDLRVDPAEMRNLAVERRDLVASMRTTLAALKRTTGTASRPESDPILAEKFMALGYIGYAGSPETEGVPLPDPKAKLEVYELTMSAFELAGKGRPDEALSALGRAAALDGNVTQVHYLAGTILGQLGRFREAASSLERAVRSNPRFVPAHFKLALAYLRLDQHDRAERTLRVVLDHEPKNVRAHHNLAAIAYARGDLARAETLERQAVAIDAGYFDAWNTLGAIYVLAKRPVEAIDALQKAIQLDPRSGRAHYNLGLAFQAAGQSAAARDTFQKACSLDSRFCS